MPDCHDVGVTDDLLVSKFVRIVCTYRDGSSFITCSFTVLWNGAGENLNGILMLEVAARKVYPGSAPEIIIS